MRSFEINVFKYLLYVLSGITLQSSWRLDVENDHAMWRTFSMRWRCQLMGQHSGQQQVGMVTWQAFNMCLRWQLMGQHGDVADIQHVLEVPFDGSMWWTMAGQRGRQQRVNVVGNSRSMQQITVGRRGG